MAAHKPHRADDKRRGGYGDNVIFTVHENDGAGPPLISFFNDRRGKNGTGKKAY